MKQLPVFVNLAGQNVVLIGDGEEADAKRRLIERAGGICVPDCPNDICRCARIGFVAVDDPDAATAHAERLRAKGMLVNVVDRPAQCDFTTPAIVDRDPVLIAVSTGGASAGMAKAIRQRLEILLPETLGRLASAMAKARGAIKRRWPDSSDRRRAIDAAFVGGGALDPFREQGEDAVTHWIDSDEMPRPDGLHVIELQSANPDDLTIGTARLLGEADQIFYDYTVPAEILNRARADAERHAGPPGEDTAKTAGRQLILYLRLRSADS